MKARFLLLLPALFVPDVVADAQQTVLMGGARQAALGDPVSVMADHWSCTGNPAGLASVRKSAFGLFYRNYFGIKELGTGGFAATLSTRSGNFGFGFLSSGYSVVTENQVSVSYGRYLGHKLRAGIALNWMLFSQPSDYRDLYAWIPSAGIQWLPSGKITLGIMIINPAQQEYIPSGYRKIASGFAAGFGYHPAETVLICFETSKFTGERWKYGFGVEISVKKTLYLRFGINRRDYSGYSLGIGYLLGRISMDVAVVRHPTLGFSPVTALNYSF